MHIGIEELKKGNLGHELAKRIINDTNTIGKVEIRPKLEGKQIVMIIQPL